jgi:hypothetical protein
MGGIGGEKGPGGLGTESTRTHQGWGILAAEKFFGLKLEGVGG